MNLLDKVRRIPKIIPIAKPIINEIAAIQIEVQRRDCKIVCVRMNDSLNLFL